MRLVAQGRWGQIGGRPWTDRLRRCQGRSDGPIAGLEIALVQGYKPESLKGIQADLDAAGVDLQKTCDAAKDAASRANRTKGIVSDIVKAAVEPAVGAIKDGVSGLWDQHLKQEQAEIDSIKDQLEAARWPDY
jgi:hypothetical protein